MARGARCYHLGMTRFAPESASLNLASTCSRSPRRRVGQYGLDLRHVSFVHTFRGFDEPVGDDMVLVEARCTIPLTWTLNSAVVPV